jgi:hypothetical protein
MDALLYTLPEKLPPSLNTIPKPTFHQGLAKLGFDKSRPPERSTFK